MGRLVNVGIIGCGEVAQIIHIPTLNSMSDFFRIAYLCDVSQQALEHCRQKVNHFSSPRITRDPEEVCSSRDVDVVFVLCSTEFHATYAVLALKNDKIAFVEKPMALNEGDVRMILEAEKASKGTVMVGYMRRYAAAFIDAVEEIGGMDQIRYATVRDIIGKNALFTPQSGTFPKYFSDYTKQDSESREDVLIEMNKNALEKDLGVPCNERSVDMWTLIGNLGSHDLLAMREALGMPQSVSGCSLDHKNVFWRLVLPLCFRFRPLTCRSAIFQYPGFAMHYESGRLVSNTKLPKVTFG